MVLAVDDDHVLGAADNEDRSLREISHVAGIEPAIGRQRRSRGFLVTEIARHDAETAHEYPADLAVGQYGAGIVADFDGQPRHCLAAIDNGAKPRRLAGIDTATGATRQGAFIDQVRHDAFTKRHDRNRQRRFGQAIARQKGAGLETGCGKDIDKSLHDFGADHVGAIAGHPPARQIKARRDIDRGRNPPRADVVTKGRRVTERLARVTADQRQPRQRPACKVFGGKIIDRNLVGERRQHAADKAHVVIPGQPRYDTVTIAGFHAMRMAGKIGEQRFMGDGDTVREARRAARILQIGDIGRLGLRQCGIGRRFGEIDRPVMRGAQPVGRLADHRKQPFRGQHHLRVATAQLRGDLVDIGFAAAKAGRQRQRHRQGAGIDGGKKGSGKARPGFGDQRDAIAGLDAIGN